METKLCFLARNSTRRYAQVNSKHARRFPSNCPYSDTPGREDKNNRIEIGGRHLYAAVFSSIPDAALVAKGKAW